MAYYEKKKAKDIEETKRELELQIQNKEREKQERKTMEV